GPEDRKDRDDGPAHFRNPPFVPEVRGSVISIFPVFGSTRLGQPVNLGSRRWSALAPLKSRFLPCAWCRARLSISSSDRSFIPSAKVSEWMCRILPLTDL